ncbi:hypothetical protein GCM10023331_29070 [Algivirga pacifica]|uniref:Uncharacterized protein n=2 Tax=Algivirga pacifica TaxID=1162670 RepID=A0ABP9DLF5_9BACT
MVNESGILFITEGLEFEWKGISHASVRIHNINSYSADSNGFKEYLHVIYKGDEYVKLIDDFEYNTHWLKDSFEYYGKKGICNYPFANGERAYTIYNNEEVYNRTRPSEPSGDFLY